MEQPGVQDVLPRLQYLPSLSTPYNLSAIFSIIPGSRFLNRLRKGGFESVTLNLSEMPTANVAEAWPSEASRLAAETARRKVEEYQIPSFWGFYTSGYMVGLMVMAILLHRIQNVVIPSPRRPRHGYRTYWPHATLWERLHAAILPLDFSRTTTRFVFHLASVSFLSRMLITWIVLILQTCQVPLVFGGDQKGAYVGVIQGYLERLARRAIDKEMAEICWSTFCAVCGAFLMEGFIKALDGLGGGGSPLGGVNSLSPFHLVSYAFLLHVHSSPVTHGFHPTDGLPSRPDKHIVITITIALLQLSIFHVLSISKRFSRHRLFPTALTSMLSLAHFHATVFFHFAKVATPIATDLPTAKKHPSPNRYVAAGATYPLMNFIPNLFETALLVTILLTVTVNAIAQLLVRGRIDHVLTGLGLSSGLPNDDGTNNGFLANLPYEEDFILVLLRIGVASLKATGLRGWNNEVAPIQRPKITPRRVWASRSRLDSGHSMEEIYGRVRMGRLGVAQVQCGSSTSVARTKQNGYNDYELKNRRPQLHFPRLRRGFANDVRNIDVGHANNSGPFRGPWRRNIAAFWQFLVVFWGVICGLVFFLLNRARRRVGDSGRARKSSQAVSEERDVEEDGDSTTTETDANLYQRFLRGEDISDDGDDAIEESSTVSGEEMSDESDEEKHFQEREGEVVDLFTDLLRSPDVQDSRTVPGLERIDGHYESGVQIALAHQLHGSAGASRPLTRSVWKTLTQRGYFDSDSSIGDQELLSDRYSRGAEERDREKGLQHICVVCMLESREVICWPCRCLAMCDGCRETLALRTTSKHRCPCCRQIVDGYSKIFIP